VVCANRYGLTSKIFYFFTEAVLYISLHFHRFYYTLVFKLCLSLRYGLFLVRLYVRYTMV
jgi:hypothetical protein